MDSLDAARSSGDWRKVAQLCGKSSKNVTLNGAMLAEAECMQAVASCDWLQGKDAKPLGKEAEEALLQLKIAMPVARLPEDTYEPMKQALLQLHGKAAPLKALGEIADNQVAVMVARFEYLSGNMEGCRKMIAFEPAASAVASSLSALYTRILLIQVFALRALSDDQDAPGYAQIKGMLSKCDLMQPLLAYPQEWMPWAEEALYQSCFYYLRREDAQEAVASFRLYLELLAYVPFTFRPLKRISILRNYLYLLVSKFRWGGYQPPKPRFNSSSYVPKTLQDEVALLVTLYEELIGMTQAYPLAGSKNGIVDNLYNDISLIYGLLGRHQVASSTVDTLANQYELLLESYFRALRHTFRSKSILRKIGWTSALTEAIEEGMMGFKMYLEKDKKDKTGEWWRRDEAEMDGELVDNVVFVLIAGCKLSLESLQTQAAVVFAEKATELCKSSKLMYESVATPLASCYLGLSYARLSFETIEHSHCQTLQEQALSMLREAVRLDPQNWRFRYSLALHCGEMGQIKEALESVRHGIRLNYGHVSSWHLMAILIAAHTDESMTELECAAKALRVCYTASDALSLGRLVPSKSKKKPVTPFSVVSGEEWFNLKLTEALMEEILIQHGLFHNKENVEGLEKLKLPDLPNRLPTEIFDSYKALFALYTNVYFATYGEAGTGGSVDRINSLRRHSSEASIRYHIDDVKSSIPLKDILLDLTRKHYPPLQTFFVSTTPYSDPSSYTYSSPLTPASSSDTGIPLRRARFLRRRKLRYMELWLQMAQVFRRADKTHDARMACLEAQKVERGNADVEFELGLIAMFSLSKSTGAGTAKADLPFLLSVNKPQKTEEEAPPIFQFGVDNELRMGKDTANQMLPFFPSLSIETIANVQPTRTVSATAATGSNSPLAKAINHFLAALAIDDEHLLARTWLGRCYYQQARYEMARAELERATKSGRIRGKKVWASWHLLGLAYQALRQFDKAQDCFAQALQYEQVSVPLGTVRGFEVLPRYV